MSSDFLEPHCCSECSHHCRSEWRDLTGDDLALFNKAKTVRRFEPGDVMFHQGSPFQGLHCIQSGLIGLRRVDEDGNSALLRLCNAGETVGYRALLNGDDHLNTAEVLVPSTVCILPRPAATRLLAGNSKISRRLLECCIRDISRIEADYARSLTKKMKPRLLHVLMIFYEQMGYRDQFDNSVLELPIQRQQLADLLGATPESISRLIKRLEREGLVRVQDRRVTFCSIDDVVAEIGPVH